MNHSPIAPEQRRSLIAAYQRTGNMTAAMREAGIRSPRTAYLWWRRYAEGGEAALQARSHARKTQQRLPDAVVEQICQLRRREPRWGRRRIANALTLEHGRQVASPASVEAVLRRAGLWARPARPTAPSRRPDPASWKAGVIDYDRLLETIQRGIRLDLQSDARAAAYTLYQEVWRPLEDDQALSNRLLSTPEVGAWLLRSRLHLGHSLMNRGDWPLAARHLQETIDWLREHDIGPRRRTLEEEPRFVSLRRDDIWLGCYQHLGLVLGKNDVRGAVGYLQTALNAMRRPHRPVVPSGQGIEGDLERDLAYLKLRLRRLPEAEIRHHLLRAQENAELARSPGVLAFTYIAWARLHDRLARASGERERGTRRQQRTRMEHALERALELVEDEWDDRPIRQTLCFVDAAELAYAHEMPIDGQRVRRAAEYCITYGYGDQAQTLLAIPDVRTCLSEKVRRNLASLSPP